MTKTMACATTLLWATTLIPLAGVSNPQEPTLRDLAPKGMLIGAALNQRITDGSDEGTAAIAARQFNSISPENVLKWESIHPEPDRYDWERADRYVAFGEAHAMAVIGHTLVWHNQTPGWVFAASGGGLADRDTVLGRMRAHIHAVVGRYKGRVRGWDVVNEAVSDDREGSLRKSKWLETVGPDFIAKAFEYAHEADPEAELYYNDYSLTNAPKRAAAIRIAKDLRDRGLRIDSIGEQGHYLLSEPPLAAVEATLDDIRAAGFKAQITELDVDVLPRDPAMYGADLEKKSMMRAETNLYPDALPKDKQLELAQRYFDLLRIVVKREENVARVTFWGVNDRQSWLNNFPIPGRVNHPLLFDRENNPKPAFVAVVRALREGH